MRIFSLFIIAALFFGYEIAWGSDAIPPHSGKVQVIEQGELKEIFTQIIENDASWSQGELDIRSFSSKPEQIILEGEKTGYRLLSITPDRYPGKKYISMVFTADDQDIATVRMDADVLFFGDVVCASKRISRNTLITPEDLTTVSRNVSMMDETVIQDTDNAIGKMAKTSIQPGAILYNRHLKKPPMVKRGDHVTILARHGALQITAPGVVKNTGTEGDMIQVKNLMSRRIIYARVIHAGLVETDL
jgi:flagellar basal body P-ring formation protein FlgA